MLRKLLILSGIITSAILGSSLANGTPMTTAVMQPLPVFALSDSANPVSFTVYQDKQDRVRIRLLYGEPQDGLVVKVEKDGITLKLDYVNGPIKFLWAEIFPEDVEFIKYKYLKEIVKDPPKEYTIPALKLTTNDGKVYEGLELKEAPPTEVWIKNVQGKFVIEKTNIKLKEAIRMELHKVYTEEEIYTLILGKLDPTTPADFEKLAHEFVRAKFPDKAIPLFKIAEVLRNPQYPENALYRDLINLRNNLDDINLKTMIHRIQEQALWSEYDRAIELIDQVERNLINKQDKKLLDEIKRIRGQLYTLRQISKEEQIINEWYRTMEALVRTKAADFKSSFKEAKSYTEMTLKKEIIALIAEKFRLNKEDKSIELIWEARATDISLKHSYDETSWLIESPMIGDPDDFWFKSPPDIRYKFIKGLFIERNMKDVSNDHKNCSTCGGAGKIEREKFNFPTSDRCPSCSGLRQFRILIYK